MLESEIPISLYIHVPWCIRKCHYCDFNSHAKQGELPEELYLQRLTEDLNQKLFQLQNRSLSSIFIGGGTPSLLSPQFYARLLEQINQQTTLPKNIEITMEANPGTAEQQRFSQFRNTGINRLSLGIQSFQDEKLKKLGRVHSTDEAQRAVEMTHKAGFSNFNLDLMFGLPDQSLDDAIHDLRLAISLRPTHLSWYQLTLEPNTFFYNHPPQLPVDDDIWQIQIEGQEFLRNNGFEQYEVSAYCQSDFQSQHNLNYWNFGDYIAIGAGAHGKYTDFETQQIKRYWNFRAPSQYLDTERNIVAGEKWVATEDLAFEFMMNALRLQKPVPISLLQSRTGLTLKNIQTELAKAAELNLLNLDNNYFVVSDTGKQYLNQLLEIFLPNKQ